MMGCFFACFGTFKHKKSQPSANIIAPLDQKHEVFEDLQPTESINQENNEKSITNIAESKGKHEKQPSCCNNRKKVTFDLSVTTYEDLSSQKVITNDLVEANPEKESRKTEETQKESETISDSITSSIVSYPLNHRYRNCTNSDDDYEDLELEESDLDDVDDDDDESGSDDQMSVKEESSESLFSLSIDSRKQFSAAEKGEKEVNSPMPVLSSPKQELRTIGSNQIARDRSQYIHSVLNPVENLTQWEAIKVKTTTPLKHHQSKENINLDDEFNVPISPEPSLKLLARNSKPNSNPPKGPDQEITVDTSLSSWLVESETTPNSRASTISVSNSPRSHEERPILGALTIEDLKQFSASSSPRRSPSRSPDNRPIIGTVGSYWSHTGQTIDSDSVCSCKNLSNTTRKYREDKGVDLQFNPFKTRLEREPRTQRHG